jgi:hypothetical protein
MPEDDLTQHSEASDVDALTDRKEKPFRVTPISFNLPGEWTSGSVSELLEMLEGPGYPYLQQDRSENDDSVESNDCS